MINKIGAGALNEGVVSPVKFSTSLKIEVFKT